MICMNYLHSELIANCKSDLFSKSMIKQSRTHTHAHGKLFMPSMQVSIFVEEGNHSSFTFAHHLYCVSAELHPLEVHLQGEKCDMGSFLYLDPRTTEKPNVGCTEQLFCLLPYLQQP